MAQGTPIVGQVLGHYLVLEQIGAGGMGLVFRASDQQLERDVAIKVLPPGMLADEAARKNFRREALALAKLNHPNIGTIYEVNEWENAPFISMEFVAGQTLKQILPRGGLAPATENRIDWNRRGLGRDFRCRGKACKGKCSRAN